ncbi:MAG: hypothetical protein A3K19_33945 [Lentisphaerae bacterium RIFOXYB12_FULL_65_16]|nr:MAG: hypothetical protein A3K19_09820 [Lentisphaerae bacterium RIFOXYB12_FULL_65_16]OGV95325.1 MAG: hypothetical protein A3K19_33945 [Lentisphaerae bacterium RIFOXYB12_FULL_65_16]
MRADALELSRVFQYERQMFAPLFQRPYVWEEKKQWAPLWTDIRTIAEKLIPCTCPEDQAKVKPHFLGAVVLDQIRVPAGKPDARLIIDGQQRLTTMQVLMESIKDLLVDRPEYEKSRKRLEKLVYNELEDEDARFKVWPTNTDRDAYRAVMACRSPADLDVAMKAFEKGKDCQIAKAYGFFYHTIQAWLALDKPDAAVRVDALVNTLWSKLRLVVIDMDEQDDAQMIFETLNVRGTPLLPSDLVKNFLFRQLMEGTSEKEVQRLHDQYWHPFERDDQFWRELVGKGLTQRHRIDIFLQNYLTLGLNGEVASNALFDEFKRYYALDTSRTTEWHLKELRSHADLFKRLQTVANQGSREGRFFDRIGIMEANTIYPFLLGLYRHTEGNSDAENERLLILEDIESFLVRRMVCRMNTRAYNRLFLDLLQEMRAKGDFTRQNVREFLLSQTGDVGRWPNNEEFRKAWTETALYHAITRPRLKMLLMAVDNAMQTDKNEVYELKQGVNVEHLLPQEWGDHWPLPPKGPEETEELFLRRKAYRSHILHTIGNLTLVRENLNSLVSNGPFERKRQEILKHSRINLNRFIVDLTEWNEDRIQTRATEMFGFAVQIWPHPTA